MEGQTIAKVVLKAATFSIDKPYDYVIPDEFQDRLFPGMRVIAPFGPGNRRTEGLVLAICHNALPAIKCKRLLAVLDENPVLNEEGIQTALWMRNRYFCTVYEAAKAMLPAGLYFSLKDRYRFADGVSLEAAYAAAGQSKRARQLAEMIDAAGGKLEIGKIRDAFGSKNPNPAIKQLSEKNILVLETSASRGIGDKTELIATLQISPDAAMAAVSSKRKAAPMRYAVTEFLCNMGRASVKEIAYFTGASKATMRSLEKSGILRLEKHEMSRLTPPPPSDSAPKVELNEEQQAAFDGLNRLLSLKQPEAALLYGVTGSGKTQVYLKLIAEVLKRDESAIVLVPEIALTPQLLKIFCSHFGNQVAVLHSSLHAGERYDEWKRVRSGEARVVLGTRSAVFAPTNHLGLLILDEEQEPSYKSENTPKYHALEVAKFRCFHQNALLLLGSATPSVESMYCAKTNQYHLFCLSRRYNDRAMPDVFIADMKEELKAGNDRAISLPLQQAIAENVKLGEQTILFLNRRGASRMVTCGECGYVPDCPRCSAYLTYHSDNRRLMCHYCGYSEPLPDECPQCGGILNFVGSGTQRVQEELKEAFPDCEVLRMDADTVTAARSHEKILSHFEKDGVPILVGTQMVAKGLDFENVTLVGAVSADQSLYTDDYRASERTFSLLTQVVGRAGRGSKRGRAIIQTYTPDNEVILCASKQDYDQFYNNEIQLRRLRGCPPFRDLFVLSVTSQSEAAALRTGMRLKRTLESWMLHSPLRDMDAQIFGPAPATVAKINNRFRYKLTLACKNTKQIRNLIAYLLKCAKSDKANKGVSVSADVNPLN